MAQVIAQVKLAPGEVGYFDEYSKVHLTLGNPVANIYSGTNCAQLRRSVKSRRIILLNGSLGPNVPALKVVEAKNGGYVIASNAEEEHKPVYIEDLVKQDVPTVKEPVPVEEVKEPPAVEPELVVKPEELEEEPKEEAKVEPTEEAIEETVEEDKKEDSKNKKNKKSPKK